MVESTATLRDYLMQVAGVDILDATGKNFKSTYQIMSELAQVWGQLDGLQKSGILDKIAGKRGSVAVSSALQNWNIAEQARDLALNGSGSMDEQLAVYESSIKASLDKFKTAFQELSTDLINSDFIKGIVDTGTTIIKIIDELVNHIGVLGTAVTGLGLAKLLSTAKNGATGIMHISDAISLFSGDAIKNLGDARSAFGLLWDEISVGANGAGNAIVGLLSNINPVTLGITGGLAAAFAAYKLWKGRQEELKREASRATDAWNDTNADVDDYSQRYAELNKQLNDANLTESERIGIKQQLLSLQNEITAKYGEQANGIDLVNGSLETQLGILSNISAEQARQNLRDNTRAYNEAERQMTKNRKYTVSGAYIDSGEGYTQTLSPTLQTRYKNLFKSAGFEELGNDFVFTGDASQFDSAVNEVLDGLEKLQKTASETDKNLLATSVNSLQQNLSQNNKILDDYLDEYQSKVKQELYANGYGDELAQYAKLTKDYNQALLSGDSELILSARKDLEDYKVTVKDITDAHAEYGNFFDEVTNSVDKSSEAVFNFKDIMDDGIADSTNNLRGYASAIQRAVSDVKKLGFDGVDVQNILLNGGEGFDDLKLLGEKLIPDFDPTNVNQVATLADLLGQLGVIATETSEDVDLTSASFDDFMKSVSASIDTLDEVNSALVNSFKSGGLSARIDEETGALTGDVQTILSAYKKELGDGGIDQIFERTASGIIVNRDALRALQAQQENTTKAEFIKRIAEAQERLSAATTDEERQAWKTRLDNVKLLASAYDGATSAYQKWVDAQNMGEAGDQYDAIVDTALKRGKELYDQGLVGTNEFRAIAQLYSNQDLALASVEEVTKAYEDGVGTVKKYFTEGQDGAVAFADKMVELGVATKEGDFYNFEEGIDTSKIADELGLSVDLVEAAFKKLGDYGFDIHFMTDDQLAEFDSLTEKAEEAQNKLKELRDSGAEVGDSKLIDIDLSEIDTVDEVKGALSELNEVVASPDIDPESAEAYQTIIDTLQEKLDLLSQTDISNEVNFTNLDSAYTLLGSLQGRMSQINSLNATSSVDIDVEGDDQVQLVAEQIANLPPEIKKAVGFEVEDDASKVIDKIQNKEVKIPVSYQQPTDSINTSGTAHVSVEYDQGDLPTVSSQTVHLDYEPNPIEANVIAKLDSTEVDNYKPKDHNPTVKYSKNSSEPDGYQPSDKYATVHYNITIDNKKAVDDLPKTGDRYITYHVNTVGNTPGNYKGTVPKSTFQSTIGSSHAEGTAHANGLSRFGLKQDENSLINELGAEIVVRPSEDSWMIFNDGMPTFAQLKRGDVVFDAEQTKELLAKGWTRDYASILGSSFASGTAHARKVVGSGSFKKATNTNKKKKENNGGGGGGGKGNGGGGGGNTKEAKEFLETLDEIEIKLDRIQRKIKNLDTEASNTFNSQKKRSNSLVKELKDVRTELEYQRKGYKRYLQEANKVGLPESWKKKVREGRIDIEDVKDEALWEKIDSYQKWYTKAIECRDAIKQLKADEADLWNQQYELTQSYYDVRLEEIQKQYDALDSYIELAENTGRISANNYRQKQIDNERKSIDKLKKEAEELNTIMNNAVKSGEVKKYSEGWYEWKNQIGEINNKILETKANIAKLKKEIRETNWEIFDKARETVSNVSDELEFLYGILGKEDDFYDVNGVVTNNGIAGLGILAAQYDVALQQHKRYAQAIKEINSEIANDKYNQDLIDRRQELYEADRKAIESSNKFKESIADVVEIGIKAQIAAMKELIDKYNDLMDTQKDETEYAKKVANAQANINTIQKQLNAYRNDDTEEGATRRQKLQNDLRKAQESLAETEEERRISQTKKMLSDLEEEYENVLNARLDNLDKLVQAVIDGVDQNASTVKGAITAATKDLGYTITDYTATIFNDSAKGVSDLSSYFTNGDFVGKVTSIATAVADIDSYYKTAQDRAEGKSSGGTSSSTAASKASAATAKAAAAATQKQQQAIAEQARLDNLKNSINVSNAKAEAALQSGKQKTATKVGLVSGWTKEGKYWRYYKDGNYLTGWHQLTKDGKKSWYYFSQKGIMQKDRWIKGSSKAGSYYLDPDGRMVVGKRYKTKDGYRTFGKDGKWLGYKRGVRNVNDDGLYWTNESVPETIVRKSDGAVLTKLNAGDTVFNGKATQTMWDFANNPQKFLKDFGNGNTSIGSGNNVNLEFNLSGLRSPAEFMAELRKDKRFEQFIQEITIGRVSGHGSLAKNAISF